MASSSEAGSKITQRIEHQFQVMIKVLENASGLFFHPLLLILLEIQVQLKTKVVIKRVIVIGADKKSFRKESNTLLIFFIYAFISIINGEIFHPFVSNEGAD